MADSDVDGGSTFSIGMDKDTKKSFKGLNSTISKLQTGNKALVGAFAQFGKAQNNVGALLKAQLAVQKKMAGHLGIIAAHSAKQYKLMQQLMKKQVKSTPPSKALMGILPAMASWKKLQIRFETSVRQLYSSLPKQINSVLIKLHNNLQKSLSGFLSKMNQVQQQKLTAAFGKMSRFAKSSYDGVFKVVAKGLAIAQRANKIGVKIMGGAQKAWQKTGGKLAEKLPSGAGGSLLAGGMMAAATGLFVKVIQASPLLSAMMKIMNTAFTLILRPIGDFFGAFFRPLFIYFLKEVAIPFFQAGRGWMKEGEKWGKVALGFFIDPVMAIYSGAMKAISQGWGALKGLFGFEATPAWVDPATGLAEAGGPLEEIDLFQKDPAAWLRQMQGIEEKTFGKSSGVHLQKDNIWDKMWGGLGGIGGGLLGLLANIFGQVDWDGIWATLTGGFDHVYQALQDGYDWIVNGLDGVSRGLQSGGEWLSRSFSLIATGLSNSLTNLSTWLSRAGLQLQQAVISLSQNLLAGLLAVFDGFKTIGDQLSQGLGVVTAGIQGAGTTIWDGLASVGETIWNGITGLGETITVGLGGLGTELKIGELDIGGALGTLGKMLEDAGTNIMAAVNVATGGLLGGLGGTSKKPDSVFQGSDAVQTGPGTYTLGGQTHYGNAADLAGKTVSISTGMTAPAVRTLGDPTGQKFEGPTGAMMDIYKTVGGVKVKIDPKSPEGQRIQAGYQKQLQNQADNSAQTAHFTKVKNMDSEQAKAYVLAGGGEAGIKAAEYTKQHGLNLSTFEGLSQLGTTGVTHSMIDTATSVVGRITNASSSVNRSVWGGVGAYTGGSIAGSVGQSLGGWGSVGTSPGASMNSVGGTGGFGGRGPGGGSGPGGGGGGGTTGGGGTKGTGGGKGSTSGGSRGPGGSSGTGGGTSGGGTSGGSKGTGGGKGSTSRSRKRQFGGIIDEPIVGTGLWSGDEWKFGETGDEWVTPIGGTSGVGNSILNIHIGNITKEADYMKLKPLIQRWILEASSRRGSV